MNISKIAHKTHSHIILFSTNKFDILLLSYPIIKSYFQILCYHFYSIYYAIKSNISSVSLETTKPQILPLLYLL